ncbi:MAG: hypothetical protein K2R98_10740 [Gemmataceae bacterium]|nr:hypothetical protein [Gemmataceae bacterium]
MKEASEPEVGVEALAEKRAEWEPPEGVEKRLLGSRVRWPDFGPLRTQGAWAWGFFGAARRAFIGDGSDNSWPIDEQWIRWVWGGDVAPVVAALTARPLDWGVPTSDDGGTNPRQTVARRLAYLQKQEPKPSCNSAPIT